MKNLILLTFILFGYPFIMFSQDTDRAIEFPDVEGYLTLKCDFHIHTVFSDGHVWPTIRVEEAVKDGLDAISLTEHLEYQPWGDDIPHPDRNRSYILAKEVSKPYDLLIIHGAEITRDIPPGHANAIFIEDANKLIIEDPYEAYREANRQGAFVFWNHPNWVNQENDGLPQFTGMHDTLLSEGLLHGIEVVNDLTFSEHALQMALEKDITVMGTSDIHGLVDWQYNLANGGHRPVSLVLAKEKSEESIKEALFEGRTITWYENILSGKKENVDLLLKACLQVESKGMIGPSSVLEVDVVNTSDARFLLMDMTDYEFYSDGPLIEVLPQSTKRIEILTDAVESEQVMLKFQVINALIGADHHPTIEFQLSKN